jgi:hypothetical protein
VEGQWIRAEVRMAAHLAEALVAKLARPRVGIARSALGLVADPGHLALGALRARLLAA